MWLWFLLKDQPLPAMVAGSWSSMLQPLKQGPVAAGCVMCQDAVRLKEEQLLCLPESNFARWLSASSHELLQGNRSSNMSHKGSEDKVRRAALLSSFHVGIISELDEMWMAVCNGGGREMWESRTFNRDVKLKKKGGSKVFLVLSWACQELCPEIGLAMWLFSGKSFAVLYFWGLKGCRSWNVEVNCPLTSEKVFSEKIGIYLKTKTTHKPQQGRVGTKPQAGFLSLSVCLMLFQK